jgi:hypothetical protein
LNLALTQNTTVLKARKDIEAAHGIVIQTRAIVIPKVQAKSSYQAVDESSIDKFPFGNGVGPIPFTIPYPDQNWSASVQIVQSIYEGGRMQSALRTARLIRDQSMLSYQTVLADTLVQLRVAYYDVLLAVQQIVVQEASVNLLARELEDTSRRYEAGTVPRFNVRIAGTAQGRGPAARRDHRRQSRLPAQCPALFRLRRAEFEFQPGLDRRGARLVCGRTIELAHLRWAVDQGPGGRGQGALRQSPARYR